MNILLAGINGKMGSQIYKKLSILNHNITGFDLKKHEIVDTIYRVKDIDIDKYDILIDFTNKDISKELIELFLENKKIVMSGTTGHTSKFIKDKMAFAKKNDIIFIHSVNFAKGIKAYNDIAQIISRKFKDVLMVESHDISKLDTPSGTALMLAKSLDLDLDKIKSLRVHEVTPSHLLIFSNEFEKITLIHQILKKDAFIEGFYEVFKEVVGE